MDGEQEEQKVRDVASRKYDLRMMDPKWLHGRPWGCVNLRDLGREKCDRVRSNAIERLVRICVDDGFVDNVENFYWREECPGCKQDTWAHCYYTWHVCYECKTEQ